MFRSTLLLAMVWGCATPLSASRTARVLEPGHLAVSVSGGESLPIGAYLRLAGKTAGEANAIIRAVQSGGAVEIYPDRDIYIGVAAALLLADIPSPITELSVRYGVLPRLELALRYSGATWRGEAFAQIYDGAVWKVAGGVGVAYRSFDHGLIGALADFDLLHVSQLDTDLTFLAGREWKYGALYFGPKAVFSRFSADGLLATDQNIHVSVLGTAIDTTVPLRLELSHSWLVGAVIGGQVGVPKLHLNLELAAYQSFYTPSVFGQVAKLGGLVVYPSVGIGTEF